MLYTAIFFKNENSSVRFSCYKHFWDTYHLCYINHPLENFLCSTSQKNNFYHSSPWFVSVIATLWYFQCWCFDYQKTPSLIYFLCLNIFFHFYACALRFTCIICTFILHIKLWINFICEFFICLQTICKHYSSLTKITR